MAENKLTDLSMDFAVQTLQLCETIHGHSALVNQLERSSTSIGANIREASYAHGKADFIAKLQIALKECYETEYWLELFQRAALPTSTASTRSDVPAARSGECSSPPSTPRRKTVHDLPARPHRGRVFFYPPHAPGAHSRCRQLPARRLPHSASKQSAHTVSPPCAHGHRYASAHSGSGAKHTSHRRICITPFRLRIFYSFE